MPKLDSDVPVFRAITGLGWVENDLSNYPYPATYELLPKDNGKLSLLFNCPDPPSREDLGMKCSAGVIKLHVRDFEQFPNVHVESDPDDEARQHALVIGLPDPQRGQNYKDAAGEISEVLAANHKIVRRHQTMAQFDPCVEALEEAKRQAKAALKAQRESAQRG